VCLCHACFRQSAAENHAFAARAPQVSANRGGPSLPKPLARGLESVGVGRGHTPGSRTNRMMTVQRR
jgi:hypothetical protein